MSERSPNYLGLLDGVPGPEEILAAGVLGHEALAVAAEKLFARGAAVEDVEVLFDEACLIPDGAWVGPRAAALILGIAPVSLWDFRTRHGLTWRPGALRRGRPRHEYPLSGLLALRREREGGGGG